jgi:hypothetical protein
MAFKVNYNQQRGDRERAKEQKKKERLARRDEEAQKRKAGREGMPEGDDVEGSAAGGDPKEQA